ncbi:hypothetical protein [Pleomorphomonas sp. JP5]|uniref:hypothetical protein n=1 Tax=Pleomorphomonas sp. JP5 TaxID=2942998 RepID=UPI002043CA94|nr:hypothetical protein [Pleomorphomonas sp. JP5]MCM5557283.1 hypothetical protein [Pleomorphomonas sp. JP5]
MRIIDLNRSGAERFEDANKVLQNEAFTQLGKAIKEQKPYRDDYLKHFPKEDNLSYPRRHNGILIEGGRGSGKTTFLLNALGEIQEPKQDWAKDISGTFHVLPLIDPTLIETKEHIIIVIISLIDKALDNHQANPDPDMREVDKAREEMAEGLGLLDRIGKSSAHGEEWEDPEWIMSRGLRKARKGRSFEIKLSKFINEALTILKKDAFVLAFDDVDTNFQHGYTILETIRKYLTSPQIILLISGDLELYGRLVRRNIYDTFGEAVLKHDPSVIGKTTTGLSEAVLELEEQYLLKIVPPQNRIPMLSLSEILQIEDPDNVKVIPLSESQPRLGERQPQLGDNKGEPLLPWASNKIREQLLESESKSEHPFFKLMSSEHLRLLVGYLRALGSSASNTGYRGIFSVFEARLRTAGIQPERLAQAKLDDTLRMTFRWLVEQDNPTSLVRFGVSSDAAKAIILHCFALSLARYLKETPDACLRSLFTLNLPISMMQREHYALQDVRKAMFHFIWEETSPNLLEVAGKLGSIARSGINVDGQTIGNLRASSFGSVGTLRKITFETSLSRLYGLSNEDPRNPENIEHLRNLVEEKNKAYSNISWVGALAAHASDLKPRKGLTWFSLEDLHDRCATFKYLLNLATYDHLTSRGETLRSISALSLFAAVGQILAQQEIGDLDRMALSSIIPIFIPNAKLAQPDKSAETYTDQEESGDSDDKTGGNDDSTNKAFSVFQERLQAWHSFAKKNAPNAAVSPSMLTRIAERIHDQLYALDEEVTLEWKTGHILHRQITNILHALLVVTSNSFGRLDSPKGSDRPLVQALQRVGKDIHPLAAIVISCPLVWAFLNPNETIQNSATATDSLREEVEKALTEWQKARPEVQSDAASPKEQFKKEWLEPPEIRIAVGRITTKSKQNTVTVDGFFDVLNVVPRYYPQASGTK